jgi:alpha-D-ribose 1-methylphosphonate 5-triphosphate synthase subunit PhnH
VLHPGAVETVAQVLEAAKQSHSAAVSFGLTFTVQGSEVWLWKGKSTRALTHLRFQEGAIATTPVICGHSVFET